MLEREPGLLGPSGLLSRQCAHSPRTLAWSVDCEPECCGKKRGHSWSSQRAEREGLVEQSQIGASQPLGIDGAVDQNRAVVIAPNKTSLMRLTWGLRVSTGTGSPGQCFLERRIG